MRAARLSVRYRLAKSSSGFGASLAIGGTLVGRLNGTGRGSGRRGDSPGGVPSSAGERRRAPPMSHANGVRERRIASLRPSMFRRRRSGAPSTLVEPRTDADEPAEGAAGRFLRGLPGLSWLEFPAPKSPLRTYSALVRGWIALPPDPTSTGSPSRRVDAGAARHGRTARRRALPPRQDGRWLPAIASTSPTAWPGPNGTSSRRSTGRSSSHPIGTGPEPDDVRYSRQAKADELARLEGHFGLPTDRRGHACGGGWCATATRFGAARAERSTRRRRPTSSSSVPSSRRWPT